VLFYSRNELGPRICYGREIYAPKLPRSVDVHEHDQMHLIFLPRTRFYFGSLPSSARNWAVAVGIPPFGIPPVGIPTASREQMLDPPLLGFHNIWCNLLAKFELTDLTARSSIALNPPPPRRSKSYAKYNCRSLASVNQF